MYSCIQIHSFNRTMLDVEPIWMVPISKESEIENAAELVFEDLCQLRQTMTNMNPQFLDLI